MAPELVPVLVFLVCTALFMIADRYGVEEKTKPADVVSVEEIPALMTGVSAVSCIPGMPEYDGSSLIPVGEDGAPEMCRYRVILDITGHRAKVMLDQTELEPGGRVFVRCRQGRLTNRPFAVHQLVPFTA